MKNNFKKFQKVPLFLSIIFFLLSFFAFILLYKNIQNNNQIFEKAEAQWQMETSKKDEIESLNRSLKMLEKERALLDTHFIQSSDVVPFLDTVEKLAPQVNAKAEVTLVDISPDNISLSVGVKATGTFESLYKFLTLLENSPYQLEFTSMDIKKVDEGTVSSGNAQAGKWSAVFKIRLLSFVK